MQKEIKTPEQKVIDIVNRRRHQQRHEKDYYHLIIGDLALLTNPNNRFEQYLKQNDQKNEKLEAFKKEYSQGVPEFKKGEEPLTMQIDEQNVMIETIVINELNEIIELEGYVSNTFRVVEASALIKSASRMIKKLKESLFGKTKPVIPLLQVHAVANFIMAEHNFNKKGFIRNALTGEDESTIKHVEEKFLFNCRKSLVQLLPQLTEDLQGKIILYIMNNYKGVKPETVENYFLP